MILDYLRALTVYFITLIFGKHMQRNCQQLIGLQGKEIINNALTSSRGISMVWNHAEVNPFVKGSGTLITSQ